MNQVPLELVQVVVPGAKTPWGIPLLKLGLRMYLNFPMIHCSQELTHLEVTAQAQEITSLKNRLKKLERKKKSRTYSLKRLYKVGLSARIDFSDDEASLGDQEDAPKQGRKIHDIDADKDITLENVHDANMFGVHEEILIQVIEQVAAQSGMESKMAELLSFKHDSHRITSQLHQKLFHLTSLENSNIIPSVISPLYNNPYLKNVQAFYAKELPISSPDPITPPAILTPSPVLPPSLLFDPRYFFVPEELLPPKKRIHSPSSSSTTLFTSFRNQTYKMYLKHHEKQVEDILNYLDELYLHRIERMEEGRINGKRLKDRTKESYSDFRLASKEAVRAKG
ncbi:hypothetical protein Tco_1146160 [Tanacetum coccineum]